MAEKALMKTDSEWAVLVPMTFAEAKELLDLVDQAKHGALRTLLLRSYHKATIEHVQGGKEQDDADQ